MGSSGRDKGGDKGRDKGGDEAGGVGDATGEGGTDKSAAYSSSPVMMEMNIDRAK